MAANTPPRSAALQARGLRAELGGCQVLHGVDLDLRNACWTSVAGPNGAGKSSLLKALAGLLRTQGEVTLLGKTLDAWSPRERAQNLAWLGQNETSGDDLTAWDVVMLGRLPHQGWMGSATQHDHGEVERAMRATQAWDWRARSLGQLSGGERQRVLLARALAVNARVLLMDEPLANLDPPHQADWMAIVRALVADGKAVISVLHEVSMALAADEVVVMAQGRVLHHGAAHASATHAALIDVFQRRIRIQNLGGQWVSLTGLPAP